MKSKSMSSVWAFAAACLILATTACSKEETAQPPNVENNKVSIVGEPTSVAKPGAPISVDLKFDNPGSGAMLIVSRNDGPLKSVPLNEGQTTYTFDQENLPTTIEEGDVTSYSFLIADERNTVRSAAVSYEVSAALYDQVQLGSRSVYAVSIPTDGIVNSGKIKLAAGRQYWLASGLHFMSGSELQMQAGAELYMNTESGDTYDLVIDEGARVAVEGTATAPVLISSDKLLRGSTPAPGDWGQFNIKGAGNGSNSGSIAYLRLEYAGDRGFRLEGVGSGTSISYVQAYRASGEGIMPTNGDVRMKYLVATDCEGGGFRFGDAYSGYVQFGISQTSSFFGEVEALTIRETASPVLANFTVTGPGTDEDDTHGLRMRANSAGKIYNSIVADFPRRGLRLNDEVKVTDLQGATVFAYSYIFNVPRDPYRDDTSNGNPFRGSLGAGNVLQNPFFNNVTGFNGSDPILAVIAGIGTNSYVPQATQSSAFNPTSIATFFSEAAFVGAVKDAATDWTKGWTRKSDGSIHQ